LIRRNLARLALRATGWRIEGPRPSPDLSCIFVGAPHTSAWDSVLMLAVAWRCDVHLRFLIKQEIGDGRFGFFWRAVGGIPVNRTDPGPLVDRLTAMAADDGTAFQLVITPKGTRKKIKYWKSGFYRLAMSADLPVTLVSPDGPTKVVTFAEPFALTGDVPADMDRIRGFFTGKRGVAPERRTEPRLRAEDDPAALRELLDACGTTTSPSHAETV
jgi:1-acyl-sn-glycerol-3-phosphate acyltransferase